MRHVTEISSMDVYEKSRSDTLVLFVHDFGNLRAEPTGAESVDVSLTHSYLVSRRSVFMIAQLTCQIDTSDLILNWVIKSGHHVIDVNVLRALPTRFSTVSAITEQAGPSV